MVQTRSDRQRSALVRTARLDRRSVLAGATGLAAAGLLGGCDRRLSGVLIGADSHPADFPTVRAVKHIGRFLAERTGGRLSTKVFSGGQLGGELDTLEIASFGGIDLSRVFLAPLNAIEPLTLPFSLPFLFASVPHMRRVMDSTIGDEVLGALEPHGLIGLCFYDSGARSLYNTRRPVRTPADMRGLKIRVPNSDLYIAMINALGANAVPVPFGETYQALAQGVLDGAENNWPAYVSARHYEVTRFISTTDHLLTPEVLVMSKRRWDRLDGADQALVREAAKHSVGVMRRLWDARVVEAEAVIAASPVQRQTVDRAAFAALMRPVWEQFITTPEQESMVQRILALGESEG